MSDLFDELNTSLNRDIIPSILRILKDPKHKISENLNRLLNDPKLTLNDILEKFINNKEDNITYSNNENIKDISSKNIKTENDYLNLLDRLNSIQENLEQIKIYLSDK